ncbi:MAG: ABC transporter ATP-binding protein/permease [Candidatus Methylopumilus sp.]|nr:ABC transporter ATP-binding protein/permease [Candidatus Methylopumilus sp.]
MKNPSSVSLLQMLCELWVHVDQGRRLQLAGLCLLMLLSTLAELISLGAVFPFLGALAAPEKLFFDPRLEPSIRALGLVNPNQLLLPLTLFFCIAVTLSAGTRMALLWVQTRVSFAIGADLGVKAYRNTMYQPYSVHVARNSAEVIAGIMNKVGLLVFISIQPVLNLISTGLLLCAITTLLLVVEPLITASVFTGFGLCYLLISRLCKPQLLQDGVRITEGQNHLLKSLQEGLGGIRDILIGGTQEVYLKVFRDTDLKLRRSSANIIIISSLPRFVMEAFATVLIAVIAFFMVYRSQGFQEAIPVLGALALGGQRLLPLLQQIYSSLTAMQGGKAVFADSLALLSQSMPTERIDHGVVPLPFKHEIALRDVKFRYAERAPWILSGINLEIKRGSRIGLIGVTGSGKSTLIDILLGLMPPSEGALTVDNITIDDSNSRSWQSRITHVPQSIFLIDANIAENIAFGTPRDKIDLVRVKVAAERAQLASSIEKWPEGYLTMVGERGIRLSGGQRQRIGIARAIYKEADVLVFDEATSALDSETESAVINAIKSLDKGLTIVVIAHRPSALKDCDKIIEISNGIITRSGSYRQFYDS